MIYHEFISEHQRLVERYPSGSSRSLLTTVLGELVLPAGGAAWTQSLTSALALLGVRDKAARQAISRLHERGWLHRARIGRQTRWQLDDAARDLLVDGAERIYGFGRDHAAWDGQWLVVMASVPERQRNARYRLTTGLTWAGFGSLGQGTWISPWPEREPEAAQVLEDVGVEGAASFRAESGAIGSPRQLAARAWDLPALRDQYDAFLATLAPEVRGLSSGAAATTELVAMVHRWRRFPFLDPALPVELLPDDWPGRRAAEAFASRRGAWRDLASRWWADTDATFGTPQQAPSSLRSHPSAGGNDDGVRSHAR